MLCTAATAQTTVSMTKFTSVTGKVGGDENVSYKAEQGNAATPPAVNKDQIRVYQKGGLFTVSVADGCILNNVTIGSAMATTVTYVTDKNATASKSKSIAENGTLSVDLTGGETSITFTCTGTSKSDRLYVNSLSVTYTTSGTTTKKDADLSFSETTATAKVGESFTAPTLTNPHNLTVTYTSSDETVATVGSDGTVSPLKAGTTTITASTEGNDTYKAGSASYELTVTGSSDDKNTVFQETFDNTTGQGGNDGLWSGSVGQSKIMADNVGWKFTGGGGASKCVKFGTRSGQGSATTPSITLTGNATLTFKAGAWHGDATTLNVSAEGAQLSQSSVTLADSKFTDYSIAITNATGSVTITFAANQASKNRFFLDEVKITSPDETAQVTDAGWATYVTKNAVSFPGAVKAFTVTYNSTNDQITLNSVTSVPANTAVVLKGAAGTYTLTKVESADAPASNDLKYSWSDKTIASGDNIYVLAKNNGVIGFWPVTVGTTVAPFKGYLDLGSNSSAKSFFSLDDAVTGVSSIKAGTKEDGVRYNLAGQRVDNNYKGVVIMNGKKFMVK